MAHSHYRAECRHGTLVSQCRCATPGSPVILDECPSWCVGIRVQERTGPTVALAARLDDCNHCGRPVAIEIAIGDNDQHIAYVRLCAECASTLKGRL